ncbi:MAG: hypothetical protein ACO1OQ_06420 [Rufibacter sp.]
MKNFTLTLFVALLSLGFASAAQNPMAKGTATIVSQQFFNSLQLTELQYIKIRNLEKQKDNEQKEAEAVVATDDLPLFLADIDARFEEALIQLLNTRQRLAYYSYKADYQKTAALAK